MDGPMLDATAEQIDRNDIESYISDTFKSIYGVRPRFMNLQAMPLVELEAEARSLSVALEQHMAEEAQREAEAAERFEVAIRNLIATGARDRATAIRWLREAESDEQAHFDDNYFAYLHGLPYGYLAKLGQDDV